MKTLIPANVIDDYLESIEVRDTFFLVCAGNGVLETGGVGRVTSDRYVNALFVHDSNAFANVVGTVATYTAANAVGIFGFADDFYFAGVVVKLSLNVCETVDTRDNLSGVFTKAVEDNAQGVFANFVCHFGDFDSAFCGSVRLVTSEESETSGFFAEKTCCEVAVSETYFAVVGNRTGNAECLQAFADSLGCVGCCFNALLDSDSGAYNVCPFCVLETDFLCVFAHFVGVETLGSADSLCFVDIFDTVFIESGVNLVNAALVTFK